MTRGWNERRQAFVQSYDGDALDASCLLMPLVFFTVAERSANAEDHGCHQ